LPSHHLWRADHETDEAEGKRLVLKDGAARKCVAVLSGLGLGGRAGECLSDNLHTEPDQYRTEGLADVLMLRWYMKGSKIDIVCSSDTVSVFCGRTSSGSQAPILSMNCMNVMALIAQIALGVIIGGLTIALLVTGFLV